MVTKLVERVKQQGATAFSQALGEGTYDVLLDECLGATLTALWDCDTLEDLHAHVTAATDLGSENGLAQRTKTAKHAFLRAVQASLRMNRPVPPATPALALTHER